MLLLTLFSNDLLAQSLAVRELWRTKGPAERPFALITGMGGAANGDVWVSDGPSAQIVVLAPDGAFKQVVGRKGAGPGEFEAPRAIVTFDAGMAVFDIGRSSIEIFTDTGEFRRRVLLDVRVLNPKGFAAGRDGGFFLSGGVFSSDGSIHRFNSRGEKIASWWGLPQPEERTADGVETSLLVAGGPITMTDDGGILFSQSAPHHIVIFPPRDTVSRTIARDPDLIEPIVNDFRREVMEDGQRVISMDWFYDQSRAVMQLQGQTILNVVTFEEDGYSLWELYDYEGRLLNRCRMDEPYWVWRRTTGGNILASTRLPATRESVAVMLRADVEGNSGPEGQASFLGLAQKERGTVGGSRTGGPCGS